MGLVHSSSWMYLVEPSTEDKSILWRLKRVLVSRETKYQRIDLVETELGKHLFIDGKTQSTLYDEKVYHEILVHPAMLTHPRPREVLILGGGEGATLREVLRHRTVEHVVMVDIDEEMIDIARKYLYEWHRGSFDDKRVELIVEDGRKFLESENKSFDVIVLDLTDPLPSSPSALLYTREFYELVKRRLSDDGIMVTQATYAFYKLMDAFLIIANTIKKVFPIVRPYHMIIPSFLSSWGFVIGSKVYDPLDLETHELRERIEKRIEGDLEIYHEKLHKAIFVFPKFIEEMLKRETRISTDKNPAFIPA